MRNSFVNVSLYIFSFYLFRGHYVNNKNIKVIDQRRKVQYLTFLFLGLVDLWADIIDPLTELLNKNK